MPTSGGGLFFAPEVTQFVEEFIGPVRPPKWGAEGKYVRSFGNLQLGASQVVVPEIEAAGRASVFNGRPQDISVIGLSAKGKSYPTIIVTLGVRWNYFEGEAQKMANSNAIFPKRDIMSLATKAMRSAIRERIHDIVAFGDPTHGLEGLFSGAHVDVITETEQIHNYDAAEIYNWVRSQLVTFQKVSLLTPINMRLMTTIDLCDILSQPFAGFGSSPISRLTGAMPGGDPLAVREVNPVNELQADFLRDYQVRPNNDLDRLVILGDIPVARVGEEADTPPLIARHFHPFDRTSMRPDTDLSQTFTGYEATTGVRFDMAQCAMYVDYPKRP